MAIIASGVAPLGVYSSNAHMTEMDDLTCKRLASAISALIARFKVGPENSPYEQLTLTDAAVVSLLWQAESEGRAPIQKEVAQALGLPKTTMTSAVKRLSARGVLEQGSGARDARARTLHLTSDGQKLGTHLEKAQLGASMAILQSLDAADQSRLIELLEKVVEQTPTKIPPLTQ